MSKNYDIKYTRLLEKEERQHKNIYDTTTTPKYKRGYSIFSSLSHINKLGSLFQDSSISYETAIKLLFSEKPEALKTLLEDTNSQSVEVLAEKFKRLDKKSNIKGEEELVEAWKYVKDFLSTVREEIPENEEQKEIFLKVIEEYNIPSFTKFEDIKNHQLGIAGLIGETSLSHNNTQENPNKYLGNIKIGELQAINITTDIRTTKKIEARKKQLLDALKIQNVNFYDDNFLMPDSTKKILNIGERGNLVDNCISTLYEYSKLMNGSSLANINDAKKYLSAHNDDLVLSSSSKDVKIKNETYSRQKLFNEYSPIISDAVASMTTLFLSRMLFEAPVYAQVEKELEEQITAKLQKLKINVEDADKDFWVTMLIQDKLQENIDAICAAYNLNAKSINKLFSENGTEFKDSKRATGVNDMIFGVYYVAGNEKIENKELTNVPKSVFEKYQNVEAKAKNAEAKIETTKEKTESVETEEKTSKVVIKKSADIKLAKQIKERKDNKYLEELRKTEEYKQYYTEAKERLVMKISSMTTAEKQKTKEEATNNIAKILGNDEQKPEVSSEKEVVSEDQVENNKAPENLEKISPLSPEEDMDARILADADATIDEINKSNETTKKEDETTVQKNNPISCLKTLSSIDLNVDSDEEIEKKIRSYINRNIKKLQGVKYNFRKTVNVDVIEKENDLRLNNTLLKKANKVADEKIQECSTYLTRMVVNYVDTHEDVLPSKIQVSQLCKDCFKNETASKKKNFTSQDIKNLFAGVIVDSVNTELKKQGFGAELSMTTESYKAYKKMLESSNEVKENV